MDLHELNYLTAIASKNLVKRDTAEVRMELIEKGLITDAGAAFHAVLTDAGAEYVTHIMSLLVPKPKFEKQSEGVGQRADKAAPPSFGPDTEVTDEMREWIGMALEAGKVMRILKMPRPADKTVAGVLSCLGYSVTDQFGK